MELTRKNYFSPEAEAKYLGSSSFKAWDTEHGGCEAKQIAKRSGEYIEKSNPAFLLGSMIHSWSSNDLQEFIASTPELFKKDGTLLAKYALGDTMIEIFKNDPAMVEMREGLKENIFVGQIGGVWFKIQVDILNILKARFCDIKTTKSMYEKYWNPDSREYESFIQKYDYPLQFTIYGEVLRQNYAKILEEALKTYTRKQLKKFIDIMESNSFLECYILAVDKQEVPDHNIIFMDLDSYADERLEEIKAKLPHIMAVRNGEIEPEHCGKCDYCRSIKKITTPIHYLDFKI
jgi:hypothetical protein